MTISTLSLELLETFLAVAESGSVSKAAQILHRSQPAISERLQRLTELAGEPLYYGIGRGVRLTAAGEAYLGPARRLRDLKREWADMVQRRKQLQEGVLKIAATNTVANYFLPQYLVRFRQDYPEIELRLRGGITDWSQYSLMDWDLFFLEEGAPITGLPPHYDARPWLEDEILAIFPKGHALAKKSGLGLADLVGEPLVWREEQSGIRQRMLQEFRKVGIEPTIRIEVNGVEAMGTAVAAGLGIGFITSTALRHRSDWAIESRRLGDPIHWTLYLVAPKAPYRSHTIARFLQYVDPAA
ncbi:LysR family transcriptional regulator [Candidatus Igneacidithiobacillus taiwanensis]|uniref:LysR family transcriptional regulator n=1 Tax=Candidatus Igneacidithiobacillus taiwanensis TaxID=1945924 RepID=UPI002899ADC1|nr:LysR family transcriptional regulator [Candidatus Igneacidithiobacillus taiwanensis]MCE5360291.1 LysR family transcriptional regulator [Acidithiobacillus sp.]